jgi:hypothetical protein
LEENFDRFNFASHKEKEMVAFRRCFFALAVLFLLSGLASAQTVSTPFTCSAAVSVPPLLRSEGYTEQIGDIVLTCTGGNNSQFAVGSPLPTANFTVSLATQVTSRLINTSTAPNISEAILMIDEPGSGLPQPVPGSGPGAPQTLCPTPLVGAGFGGCQQFPIIDSATGLAVMSSSSTTRTNPDNMYLGLWNSIAPNQISFQGVPILPAVSSGITRVYRITNIRANVSGLAGAGFAGTQQLSASVAISSSTSITLNQPVQVAGFIQASLSVSTRNLANTGGLGSSGASFAQCASEGSPVPTGLLQYQENFATAFKIRNNGGQSAALTQNIPGFIYNSESGFEIPTNTVSGTSTPTGLADYGTRFLAAFHNIPSGVRMFVSVNNVTNSGTAAPTSGASAVMVASATQPDFSTVSGGTISNVPAVAPTTTVAGIPYAEIIADSTGTAVAAWESITNNPAAIDTYDFVFAQLYSSTSGINTPPIPAGSSAVFTTVNMSYAPIPSGGSSTGASASTLTAWANASGTLTIPRFADTSTAVNAFNISICETVLIFPFVTNTNGFDTGLAIANTTQDPLGTKNQVGVCNLSAYGSGAPTSQPSCTSSSTATGLFCMPGTGATGYNVLPGTVSATLASAIAPGFQGYIVAVCNFQLAHGFAFVSDVGARNLAMGYLAIVTGTPTNNAVGAARNAINESIAH